jgi:hypothetical protein
VSRFLLNERLWYRLKRLNSLWYPSMGLSKGALLWSRRRGIETPCSPMLLIYWGRQAIWGIEHILFVVSQ